MTILSRLKLPKSINLRALVSTTLLLVVVVMLVTSGLMFFKKHNTTTSLVHTVLGLAFLLVILWHLKNNFPSLKQYFKLHQRGKSFQFNGAAPLAILLVATLTVLSIVQYSPLLSFYAWGSALRAGEQTATQDTFTYVRLDHTAANSAGPKLTVDLRKGPYFDFPQYAIWLETLDGELIQPLYVTSSLAESRFENRVALKDKNVVLTSDPSRSQEQNWEQVFNLVHEPGTASHRTRPESLPVFLHKVSEARERQAADVPSELDGYSGATIVDNFLITTQAERSAKVPYKVRLEINQSFDFNQYYSSDRFPDDPIYSGNGFSAQPSIIYETVIDPASPQRYYAMQLIGHGHHSGQNGDLYHDLSNLTTALAIVDRIIVEMN